MKSGNRPIDSEIRQLLDGKLPAADADSLRRQLERESRRLEQEIRDRLGHSGSGTAGVEPAPAALRKRLRAIPGRAATRAGAAWQWGMALALIVLMIMVPVVYRHMPGGDIPSPAEVAQARAELAVAFAYVRQISNSTDRHMRREISHAMQDALWDGIFLGVKKERKQG